jgi:hypothetical protein
VLHLFGGNSVAEKRGWRWALTSFVAEIWGETDFEAKSLD